ncbi:MAG: GntR family transcriptional regulator, partial [Citricoccus sp.]
MTRSRTDLPRSHPHRPICVYAVVVRASERAYQTLRREIIDGHLRPGSLLGEVEQSERLGLSRTPWREAIGRLVA